MEVRTVRYTWRGIHMEWWCTRKNIHIHTKGIYAQRKLHVKGMSTRRDVNTQGTYTWKGRTPKKDLLLVGKSFNSMIFFYDSNGFYLPMGKIP